MSKQLFGFDLLAEQAAEFAREEVRRNQVDALGDTPIEKLFFAALRAHARFGGRIIVHVWGIFDPGKREFLRDMAIDRREFGESIFVEPQVQLEGWRVDFLVYAPDWTPGLSQWHWREPLIVECDGHEFHERTKEQAAKDRSRDRSAVLAGREVFRFTGSELWRNPWGCAEQVFDWAERGL